MSYSSLSKTLETKWKYIVSQYKNMNIVTFDKTWYAILHKEKHNDINFDSALDNICQKCKNNKWEANKFIYVRENTSPKYITRYDIEEFLKLGLIEDFNKNGNNTNDDLCLKLNIINKKIEISEYSQHFRYFMLSKRVKINDYDCDKTYNDYYLKLTQKGINYFKDKRIDYLKWILPVSVSLLTSVAAIILAITKK